MPGIGIIGGRFGGESAPCPTLPELVISLSHSVPVKLGATGNITATASGFTPSGNYTFRLPLLNGQVQEITQASNVLAWTADCDGEREIVVSVSDGSSDVFGSATVDVEWIYFDELTAATPSQCVGLYRGSASYAGAWAKVKNLTTGVEQDIPFNGNIPDWQALRDFGGLAECRYVRIYDSFGKDNDWFSATLVQQPVALLNGSIPNLNGKPIVVWATSNRLNTASGGTDTPIVNSRHDVYMTIHTSANKFSLLNARNDASQGVGVFCFNGDAGGSFSNIGTPSVYIDGTYIGTTSPTRDFMRDELVGDQKVVSLINAVPTVSTQWGFGNYGFGYNYVGQWYNQVTYLVDTSAERTDIESALSILNALQCI